LPEPVADLVRGFPRQALHAFLIQFRHPVTDNVLRFESALPQDVTTLVEALEGLDA
jgi:23S rRNA pseudouridine1911/1915/1917 synthase